MNKLEDLVPDRKLCEQIPDGCFENTALAWDCDYERWYVAERETVEPAIAIPAPTLKEIMVALPENVEYRWFNGYFFPCHPKLDASDFAGEIPEDAALKLWLRLNKSDRSDKSDLSDTDRKGGAQ